jgi:type II secretory pathway pseudopilin PulG
VSLVEIVLSLFLVTLTFAAVASVIPGLQRQATQARNRYLAMAAAQGVLQGIRSLPYGVTVPEYLRQPQRFQQVIEGVPTAVVIQVQDISFEPQAPGRLAPDPAFPASKVRITVAWTEGAGQGRHHLTVEGGVGRR